MRSSRSGASSADASHQLRTPLTGLRLRIEEAQAVGVSPAAERELDEGLREVDRLSEMVDELLVLSRAGERPTVAAERVELARRRGSRGGALARAQASSAV